MAFGSRERHQPGHHFYRVSGAVKKNKTMKYDSPAEDMHGAPTGIRIVLIEDDETIRTGYAYLLGKQPGFIIVSSYASAEAAVRNTDIDAADVYLLDISLTGISGIDAIETIKQRRPQSYIIMLTAYEDPDL